LTTTKLTQEVLGWNVEKCKEFLQLYVKRLANSAKKQKCTVYVCCKFY